MHLGAHPVGLDVQRVSQLLKDEKVSRQIDRMRKRFGRDGARSDDMRMILSVERLDYTKGILEKLLAYEKLLEARPELHGKITLISICVPAAKEMKVYAELLTQIEQVVGRINGSYARVDWTPLQFFYRSVPFEDLMAYYAAASICWITPLRDGLNLVVKEYIAVQGLTEGDGTVVLSEFAGAAAELKDAMLTNPHDPADLLEVISQAIDMHPDESRERLKAMFDVICHNDIRRWSSEFLAAVAATPGHGMGAPSTKSLAETLSQ